MYLVFFGYGFSSITSAQGTGTAYLEFLTPGIMSFQAVMAGTVGGGILWADRRWGMLSQLLSGPFTRMEYLMGIMLTSLLFGLGGGLVMLGVAFALLGHIPTNPLVLGAIFGAITLGAIFFGSLMLLLAALVKSNNAYNSLQILVIFVVNFASTVFYPESSGLPLALRVLFEVNPLTYIANTARGAYLGTLTVTDGYQMLLLAAETAVVLFLAVRSYMRSDLAYE
jgi:ABC-2 type transport system permease protein